MVSGASSHAANHRLMHLPLCVHDLQDQLPQFGASTLEDAGVAIKMAEEFERLRQQEVKDANSAADFAQASGCMAGHLPGREPPSIAALKKVQPAGAVAMYDAQVRMACSAHTSPGSAECPTRSLSLTMLHAFVCAAGL